MNRIFTIPKVGDKLKQDSFPLTYTPRKFVGYPYNNIFYQIETDHRAYAPAAVQRIVAEKVRSQLCKRSEQMLRCQCEVW